MDSKQRAKTLRAQIRLMEAVEAMGKALCRDDEEAAYQHVLDARMLVKELRKSFMATYPESPDTSVFASLPVREPVAMPSPKPHRCPCIRVRHYCVCWCHRSVSNVPQPPCSGCEVVLAQEAVSGVG